MQAVKTIEDVAVEIRHAVLVLNALPKDGPRRVCSSWPDYPLEGSVKNSKNIYLSPLPDEIDDMDLVFEQWLKVLTPDDRKLVFCRASGWGWKKLAYVFGHARSTIYLHYTNALNKVLSCAVRLQEENEEK